MIKSEFYIIGDDIYLFGHMIIHNQGVNGDYWTREGCDKEYETLEDLIEDYYK